MISNDKTADRGSAPSTLSSCRGAYAGGAAERTVPVQSLAEHHDAAAPAPAQKRPSESLDDRTVLQLSSGRVATTVLRHNGRWATRVESLRLLRASAAEFARFLGLRLGRAELPEAALLLLLETAGAAKTARQLPEREAVLRALAQNPVVLLQSGERVLPSRLVDPSDELLQRVGAGALPTPEIRLQIRPKSEESTEPEENMGYE